MIARSQPPQGSPPFADGMQPPEKSWLGPNRLPAGTTPSAFLRTANLEHPADKVARDNYGMSQPGKCSFQLARLVTFTALLSLQTVELSPRPRGMRFDFGI